MIYKKKQFQLGTKQNKLKQKQELRQGNLYTGGRCTTNCAVVNQLFDKLFKKKYDSFFFLPIAKLKAD